MVNLIERLSAEREREGERGRESGSCLVQPLAKVDTWVAQNKAGKTTLNNESGSTLMTVVVVVSLAARPTDRPMDGIVRNAAASGARTTVTVYRADCNWRELASTEQR